MKPLITTLQINDDGCSDIRIVQPFDMMNKLGIAEAEYFNSKNYTALLANLEPIIESSHIMYLRSGHERRIRNIKDINPYCKIVLDLDDDPFSHTPYDPNYVFIGTEEFYHQVGDRKYPMWVDKDSEIAKQIREGTYVCDPIYGNPRSIDIKANKAKQCELVEAIQKADLVIVSTDRLKKRLSEYTNKLYVFPNSININKYKPVKIVKPLNEVRIGWAGGCSHYGDLAQIAKPLARIMKNYPNVMFYISGAPDLDLFYVAGIPKSRIIVGDWCVPEANIYRLMTQGLDIGLCPLRGTEFDMLKSALKWNEYTTIGAATLAANVPPYSDAIQNYQTGVLYSDEEEFVKHLGRLIENPTLRQELVTNARIENSKNYSLEHNTKKLVERLNKLLEE
jgi:glycosyltransferase involved in cell wall biosynthesis